MVAKLDSIDGSVFTRALPFFCYRLIVDIELKAWPKHLLMRRLIQATDLRSPLFALALLAVLVCCYYPALQGGFIWDDVTWFTDPDARALLKDVAGLWKMWAEPGALQHYFPVTGTSFWLDHKLWGNWTMPMHLENVVLHWLTAVLLGVWLRRHDVLGAGLAAAVFALHPMMGESVAWITERKNVLSGVLCMLSMLAYSRAGAQASRQFGRTFSYVSALLLFAASLLAKSSVVCVPPVLLMVAWWRRGRIQLRRDVLPALPFFVFALACGMLTLWMEKHRVGADGTPWEFAWPSRLLIAGRAVWFYALSLACPANVCAIYPKWNVDPAEPSAWVPMTGAILTIAFIWRKRERLGRGALVAVVAFVAALFPVLGFFNVYGMKLSFVADRWAYLPGMALIPLMVSAITPKTARWQGALLWKILVTLVLLTLACLTWKQSARFQSDRALWQATIASNPQASHAHLGLAVIYAKDGEDERALTSFEEALRVEPRFEEAHHELGVLLLRVGRLDSALPHLREAVAINPADAMFQNSLGLALAQSGEFAAAITSYDAAVKLNPDYAEAWSNRGNVLAQSAKYEDAIQSYQKALTIDPDLAEVHANLGVVLAQQGKPGESIESLITALSLKNDFPNALANLKEMLRRTGRLQELPDILTRIEEHRTPESR